jgi:hypothetical protein
VHLVGDLGYSYSTTRRLPTRRYIRDSVSRRTGQRPGDGFHVPFDHLAYWERNRVQCLVNRPTVASRAATRNGRPITS